MIITSTRRPVAGKPQEVLHALDQPEGADPQEEIHVEVDEANDSKDLAGMIEALPPAQQDLVAAHTARLVAQMPLAAQQSATEWFEPSARNAMIVGGVGGFGAGALLAGLRATNNPYLVLAGTVASGIATGYVLSRMPKKRMQVKGKASGWLGSVEFDLAAETETPPSK